jgi:arylsulfatase A-like enzyme
LIRRILGWRCFATAGLTLLALGCGGAPTPASPRDILLVSIDTLRADRVGAYGKPDAGTPVLDGLAARGLRFADAMAPSPITLPSHASLFTGLEPLRHRVRHNGLHALSAEIETLAEQLASGGFRTGAFVGSVVLAERYGLARGFERYTAPSYRQKSGLLFLGERPADEVNLDALAWLDSIGDAPFFLFVHYMEPHAPRRPPEPERTRFAGDPYQAEIAATDRAFGALLEGLGARGRLDETLVVVVADHGESRSEHGEISHGIFLYQSTLHVPMIAAGPGVMPGRVEPAPVGLVDVAPTLLDAAGLPPAATTDGVSLWPVLTGAAAAPERSLYAESFVTRFDYGWSELRAIRRGAEKYVSAPRPELYRLDEDPGELINRAGEDSDAASALAAELAGRIARAGDGAARPDPVRLDHDDRSALAALGYLPGAFSEEGGAGLPDPKDLIADAAELERAARLQAAGRVSDAIAALRRLVDENPGFLEARVRLILLLLSDSRHEDALEEIEGLDLAARSVPEGEKVAARAHLLIAGMYAEQQLFSAAEHELELALATPQPPEVYVLLAAIRHDLGDVDGAIGALDDLEATGEATAGAREMRRYLEGRGPPPRSLSDPGGASTPTAGPEEPDPSTGNR